MAHEQALALARSGRLQAARRSSNRAMDLAVQEGEREAAATYQAARAVWEAVCGNAGEGKKNAHGGAGAFEWAGMSNTPPPLPWVFRVALLDRKRSPTIWRSASRKIRSRSLPTYRFFAALAALGRGKPADSVERLQIALPYELAANGLNFSHLLSWRSALGLCARRGLDGRAAVCRKPRPNFRRFSIIAVSWALDPIGALAHLQLGRVFALSGDKTKAKAAYEAFLALWKDADADIPILKSARAEYARL